MNRQKGVTLVETALTISIFMVVVMGAIEFSLMMYTWARGYEAAREGVRKAIVSDPVTNLSALDCTGGGGTTSITVDCTGSSNCDDILPVMQLFLSDLDKDNVEVTYSCTDIGFDERPQELLIPEVKVEIVDYTYQMVIPTLIGMPASWPIPPMTSTRTGEDLRTVGG